MLSEKIVCEQMTRPKPKLLCSFLLDRSEWIVTRGLKNKTSGIPARE